MAGTAEKKLAKQQRFMCFILIAGILLTAVSVVLSYRYYKATQITLLDDTITLYTVTKPVGIHVYIDYDTKPNELTIISPDNQTISDFMWVNDNIAEITFKCTTYGEWKLHYVAPDTDNISIHTDIIPIDQLVILDFECHKEADNFVCTFVPYYGNGSQHDQYFNYTMYGVNGDRTRSVIIADAAFAPVNTSVKITFPLSDIPEDTNTLKFVTQSPYQTTGKTDVMHANLDVEMENVNERQPVNEETQQTTETSAN